MSQNRTVEVGEIAPDFYLSDSTGTSRRLSDLAARGPTVVIFYRGHW